MTACTTLVKLPSVLSSRNRSFRQVCLSADHTTSTTRLSICSPEAFHLMSCVSFAHALEVITHCSHSSSSTSMTSKNSWPRWLPQFSISKKSGFCLRSASCAAVGEAGNRNSSLKSTEFSPGGFHLMLCPSYQPRVLMQAGQTHIFLSVPTV